MANIATTYTKDVISGKQPACKFVIQACKRYISDLKKYDFDEVAAERAVKFMQLLRHTKGSLAGELVHLEPWEVFIIYNIFGFQINGKRRFKRAYVEVPRKNGKTFLGAAIALYCFIADNENGAEVYTAATKLDQAAICFEQAYFMSQKFNDEMDLSMIMNNSFNNRRMVYDSNIMKPLSKEHKTLDGLNPHCAIIDEYHAHPSDELYNVIVNGMGSRKNPLLLAITTAGFDKQSACYNHRGYCTRVLDGSLIDENLFTVIYTMDSDDDWTLESTWKKANPNYGISVNPEFIKQQVKEAMQSGTKEVEFRTKLLNEWMDAYTTWIPDSTFQKCAKDLEIEEGAVCYGGLDLASTGDFSALTFDFFSDKHRMLTKYYIPEDKLREWGGEIGANLRKWARDGFITVTPGNTTDYDYIEKDIREFCAKYTVVSVGYDPYNAKQFAAKLFEDEINMRPFGQNITNISLPTKRLGEAIESGGLEYDGNPVTRWQMSNVQIYTDANLNIKIVKSVKGQHNRNKKVDGIVSMAMALGEAIDEDNKKEWFFNPVIL